MNVIATSKQTRPKRGTVPLQNLQHTKQYIKTYTNTNTQSSRVFHFVENTTRRFNFPLFNEVRTLWNIDARRTESIITNTKTKIHRSENFRRRFSSRIAFDERTQLSKIFTKQITFELKRPASRSRYSPRHENVCSNYTIAFLRSLFQFPVLRSSRLPVYPSHPPIIGFFVDKTKTAK